MPRAASFLAACFALAFALAIAAPAPRAAAQQPQPDPDFEAQRAPPGSIYVLSPTGGELAEAFAVGLGPRLRQHLAAFVLAMQVPEPGLRILSGASGQPAAGLVAQLDALAVVSLRLETAQGRGRVTRSLWLALNFAPFPGLPARVEFAASSAAQDPAAALAEFERALGPRWTRHAVLAIAAREFALLGQAAEPPRLRALQHFLAQEARQAAAADPDAAALQALREAIDQSPRLRGRR